MSGRDLIDITWTNVDWDQVDNGTLPTDGEVNDEWEVGDVEAALEAADLVLDETTYHQSTSHQPLESRTAMAYWQNGKCYMHVSTQSLARTQPAAARMVNVEPENVVVIGEYCGGGFGSKIFGSIQAGIPGLLSQKAGKPVQMRINRQEENFIGRARPGMVTRIKVGYRSDGKVSAIDMFTVQDGGPYGQQSDMASGCRPGLADEYPGELPASRRECLHQHAAADCTARTRWRADSGHSRAHDAESGQAARHRPAGLDEDQCAYWAAGLRSASAGRAGQRVECVRERSGSIAPSRNSIGRR